MTSGFHNQNVKSHTINSILTYIEEYTWEKHLANYNATENSTEVIKVTEDKTEEKQTGIIYTITTLKNRVIEKVQTLLRIKK